jgi:hypothetical protein
MLAGDLAASERWTSDYISIIRRSSDENW